jgi:hypothetical protein
MNGGIAAELRDLIDETEGYRLGLPRVSPGADVSGDGWVGEAIREMARAGAVRPNVTYVTRIVNRWRRQGFKSENKGGGHSRGRVSPDDTAGAGANRQAFDPDSDEGRRVQEKLRSVRKRQTA